MAVKLHRCGLGWFKVGLHPCWKVQKTLDEQGVEYEVVEGPLRDRSAMKELSGQTKYPVIEFEDGSAYREDSKEMAARISSGRLRDEAAPPASQAG